MSPFIWHKIEIEKSTQLKNTIHLWSHCSWVLINVLPTNLELDKLLYHDCKPWPGPSVVSHTLFFCKTTSLKAKLTVWKQSAQRNELPSQRDGVRATQCSIEDRWHEKGDIKEGNRRMATKKCFKWNQHVGASTYNEETSDSALEQTMHWKTFYPKTTAMR